MNNLRVRGKLFLSFAIVLLIMAVMVGFSIFSAVRMNEKSQELKDNWLHSVVILGNMMHDVGTARNAGTIRPLQTDSTQLAETRQLLEKNREGLMRSWIAVSTLARASTISDSVWLPYQSSTSGLLQKPSVDLSGS